MPRTDEDDYDRHPRDEDRDSPRRNRDDDYDRPPPRKSGWGSVSSRTAR